MTTHRGSCHCGRIAFEVEGEIEGPVTECNCSICRRRGHRLWFVPRESLSLTTPEAHLASYTFGKEHIRHHFCPVCGCAPFGEGAMPDGTKIASVNIRCLEGVDVDAHEVSRYDGASL